MFSSNHTEKVWIWKAGHDSELYLDKNEIVRFRVEAEEWHNVSPQRFEMDDGDRPVEQKTSLYSITVRSLIRLCSRHLSRKLGLNERGWAWCSHLVGLLIRQSIGKPDGF